jgi:hypothetical protein
VTSFLIYSASHHRILFFAEHSALAFFALSRPARRVYEGCWLGAGLLLNYLAVAALYRSAGDNVVAAPLGQALAFGWAASLAGAAIGVLWQLAGAKLNRALRQLWFRLRTRDRAAEPLPRGRLACLLNVTVKRQSIFARSTASAFACASLPALAIGLLALWVGRFRSQVEALAFLLVLVLLALILLSRMNAHRVKFLSFLGFGPLAPGLMPIAAMAVFVSLALGFVPAVAPAYAAPGASIMLALLALFALFAYWRSLHYRLKPRAAADFAMQIDALCAALLGFVFAPLALAFVVVRIYRLHRQAGATTWSLS